MLLPHYLQKSPKRGSYTFRLAVPEKLRVSIGKREIKQSLKTKNLGIARRAAIELYDYWQARFQQIDVVDSATASPHEVYADVQIWAKAHGFDPTKPAPPYTDEHEARDAIADAIVERIRQGKAKDVDHLRLDALVGRLRPPIPSIRDAVSLYLGERNGPDARDEAKRKLFEQRARRTERYLLAAFGRDKLLTEVSRADARAFRDFLLAKRRGDDHTTALKPGSINRTINDVLAIFNHANDEYELGIVNPFKNLKVQESQSRQEQRRSFRSDELREYLSALAHGNDEARNCTTLMTYTGARTSEITGLEVGDVQLACDVPHIIIRPNALRGRLKTKVSQRRIPLIGAALDAAKAAVDALKGRPGALFPRYAKGRDSLSALQNTVIRKRLKIADPKLKAYSTRHTMKDWLRNANVSPALQDAIMGHNKGQISEGYGDGYWLPALQEALEKAVKMQEGT